MPQLKDTPGPSIGTAWAESLGIREAALVLEVNSATSARELRLLLVQEAYDLPREANFDS